MVSFISFVLINKILHVAKKKKLLKLLDIRSRIRTRNYVTLECISSPADSPWRNLLKSGKDINWIALTSLNKASFSKLHQLFELYFVTPNIIKRTGRPRKLDTLGVLGLLLTYYCGGLEYKNLCQIFGIPPATCSKMIKEGEEALQGLQELNGQVIMIKKEWLIWYQIVVN
jgi:hypothetical protein